MSALRGIVRRTTDLSDADLAHLHRLLADWQLLADLNFADLLLFARARAGGFVILAQVRPYPAQTLYQEDMVGAVVPRRPKVEAAFTEMRIVREGDPEWRDGTPIREEAIPVMRDGRVVAVVSSEQNLATARTPSKLELSYLQAAAELAQMIADGAFPFTDEEPEQDAPPRVGDGFLRLDPDGVVTYASPNAVSAYRRIGVTANLIGERIGALGIDEDHLIARLARGHPVSTEVEANGAWIMRRFIPIVGEGGSRGALGFVRDTTDLRRRDRMLLLKDATIREIHHRVKNNLQTVASLLRMQVRRVESTEAKDALNESIRRISSIALVHETLSQDSTELVEFDHVAQRVVDMVGESMSWPEHPIRFVLNGSAGEISSEVATPLALVLNELCQNAVDHAFGQAATGTVEVSLQRRGLHLRLVVADNGAGLPDGFALETTASLGLQIVRTLVESELGGVIVLTSDSGTRACVDIPLAQPS
ncbi:MAG: PAS domain-containing sensor histidine kinase [Actinomycetota bacterium]